MSGATKEEAAFRRRVATLAEQMTEAAGGAVPGARAVVEQLGAAGLVAQRWDAPDDVLGVALVEELAFGGLATPAIGVSLHVESFVSILRRYGPPDLAGCLEAAIAGRFVGCVAASEPRGGSDLMGIQTRATRIARGWRIEGDKKFVTLASSCDATLVLARPDDAAGVGLGLFLVPRSGFEIVRTHRLVGATGLDTSWIRIDTEVPQSHLLGGPGQGLTVLTMGLTRERLAIAAHVVGACRLALGLATAHAMERRQFGRRLFEHQALRLRLARLHSELQPLRSQLRELATACPTPVRATAGLKVTAARFAESCVSECMHVFGGDGYVEDASPLGDLWRTVRLARLGGGTDEMMWEIVARGLRPHHSTYGRMAARR